MLVKVYKAKNKREKTNDKRYPHSLIDLPDGNDEGESVYGDTGGEKTSSCCGSTSCRCSALRLMISSCAFWPVVEAGNNESVMKMTCKMRSIIVKRVENNF